MAARTLPTNVAMSNFGQPLVGEKNKTVVVTGPFNAVQTAQSVATSDVVTVGADYGVFDTTVTQNLVTESTNLRDPA